MKVPDKVLEVINQEAVKNARFSWCQGWEQSSGYIKSELRGDSRFGGCRIYVKWEKKKAPTEEQIKVEIEKYIQSLLQNEQHHQTQRDFRHYLLETFFVDVKRLEKEAIMHVVDVLPKLIRIVEASEEFTDMDIQGLHNSLKDLEAGVSDAEALERFLDQGRKRIGE